MSAVAYNQSEQGRARLAAYRARPEVRERIKERDAQRAEKLRASARAYRKTAMGKIRHCRTNARARLKRETDPDRRARLEALIAAYDAEIARMVASLEGINP